MEVDSTVLFANGQLKWLRKHSQIITTITDLISRLSMLEMHFVGTTDRSWSIGSSPLVKPDSNLLFSSSVACNSGTRNSSSL